MEIISIGHNFKHDSNFNILRPNGLNEYLFLIIRSTALFEINGQKLHIKPNSMILIDKNTPHFFYADSDLFINDWIALTFNEKESLQYTENNIKLNTFFSSSDTLICSEMIKYIQNEIISNGLFKENNIKSMLQIILNKLQENSVTHNLNKKYYNELQKLRDRIYSNPTEKFTIEQLANEVHLSKSYFQYCYKLYFKASPFSDVVNSRIEYSKQLLLSTNFSIAEIAEIIGYANDIQFIKQFKKITKKTPKRYRTLIFSDSKK